MTPEQLDHDEHRAALALLAAAADHNHDDAAAILGPGWRTDRRAVMAYDLAVWLAGTLRRLGQLDAAQIARDVIADTIAAEARRAAP